MRKKEVKDDRKLANAYDRGEKEIEAALKDITTNNMVGEGK
jgi:hypothetical protein